MGLFDMFAGPSDMPAAPIGRDPADNFWFGGMGSASEIGVNVTVARARQVPVIRSCLSVLSESVAGLQFGVVRRVDDHTRERVEHHPIARLLNNPNARMTGFDFINAIVDDLSAEGDFYAEMIWSPSGDLVELQRLQPDRVTVDETPDGTKRFHYTDKFNNSRILLEDEVWHIPRPPLVDSIRGSSPILMDGKEAVAVAIALQRYANVLFSNDATPPYVWAMPAGQSFKSPEDKKNFVAAIKRWMGGRRRHNPAVIEYGIEPKRLGLTAEEAQFLETRKELWLDLIRLWRVPPHKVGIMDRATFSNIEHQSIEFVTDTLRPILELIERSVNKFLIGDEEHSFEFNVRSLLRGDLKARYEAYAIGRQWGWLSVNDVLRAESENGIGAAGDRYMEPLNMVPVGSGADRRQNDDGVQKSIAFLRESVAVNGGRPRLEIVKDAA
ncbi:MAG: phage portal protein [Shimia thalassica]|uniref:phage portal protein n=1 Tax=Shimia thalassica TaxID=1715693 RepID=UPI003296EFF5